MRTQFKQERCAVDNVAQIINEQMARDPSWAFHSFAVLSDADIHRARSFIHYAIVLFSREQ